MMRTRLAVSILLFCAMAIAQDLPRAAAFVGASADGVRFLSSPSVVALRVQVFSPAGSVIFDSDWKSGNVLDWLAASPLAYGSYRIVVESKDLAGQLSRKEATLRVDPNAITVDGMGSESPHITLLAHDGQSGQLVTTSGDLSFRFGDYLNRKDAEVMRLSAGGELQVKGLIRTGEGIVFPDGSVQTSAAMPSIVRMRPSGGVDDKLHPRSDTGGTGTTNQIAKWVNATDLGNSAVSEIGGSVTIGSIAAQGQLQIAGSATQDVFAGMGPNIVSGPAMNYGYAGLSFGRGAGFFNVRPDSLATAPNPSLRFMTKNAQRMIITNVGDVGINTLAPAAKLHIVGADAATSGTTAADVLRAVGGAGGASPQGIGGNGGQITLQGGVGGAGAVAGTGGAILLQGGVGGAGQEQDGSGGSIILEPGLGAGALAFAYAGNVILADTGGRVGVGTATPTQLLDVNGNGNVSGNVSAGGTINTGAEYDWGGARILGCVPSCTSNLFVGVGAGTGTTGSSNTFAGANAGQATTTGYSNSFFGSAAGSANITGAQNSYFGQGAGARNLGGGNSFFGDSAGFGQNGVSTGSSNASFGQLSGYALTSGNFNAFFGVGSALTNTTGSWNTILGYYAGQSNTTESGNTFLGALANGAAGISNATAIGYQASVTQSNSLTLGSATTSTNVGIGTTAPYTLLHLQGSAAGVLGPRLTLMNSGGTSGAAVAIDMDTEDPTSANDPTSRIESISDGASSSHLVFLSKLRNDPTNSLVERMRIKSTGQVSISTWGGGGTQPVCRNGLNEISDCSSSIRYKDSITTFGRGLDLIRQLRPVTFRWKDGGQKDVGLIAEEVEKVEPLLTVYNDAGKVEGVKYDHLTVALINAVQEQQTRLDEEKNRADRLTTENAALRARIDTIEKAIAKLTTK